MNDATALIHLAQLLRVAAQTAREIGEVRAQDRSEIAAISQRTDEIARDLESIGRRPHDSHPI